MARRMRAIKIEGADELRRTLSRMKVTREDVLPALLAGAEVIQASARGRVSVDEGDLRASIKTKILPGEPATVVVRPEYKSAGADDGTGSAGYHAHLVEFGTVERTLATPRTVTLGGKTVTITTTGTMPAKPFMRPAFDENSGRVAGKLKTSLWDVVQSKAREAT